MHLTWLMVFFSFSIVWSKKEVLGDSKYEQLKQMSKKSPLINLDSAQFKYFAEDGDKNYSIFVYFKLKGYSLPSIFFQINDNLNDIAYSLAQKQNQHISGVFFAKVVDNELTKRYCKKFYFNLMPIIVHFPASGEMCNKDLYNLRLNDGSLDSINFWVRARTTYQIAVVKKFSYVKFGLFLALVCTISIVYKYFGKAFSSVNNRQIWSVVAIAFVAFMQGGLMYCVISQTPFVGKDDKSISWISHGMRGQYTAEAYIVGILYCLGAFCSVILSSTTNLQKFNFTYKILSFVGLIASISILVHVSKLKAPWMYD